MGILVDGKELPGPEGVLVKNFLTDPSVFRFRNQIRVKKTVTEVVVHETVTTSWQSTVSVLKMRQLGVHFIADADGTVYQHADLLTDEMWHGSQHNDMSVGIETVNPFEPNFAPKNSLWTNVLKNAPWSVSQHPPKQYLVPTAAQAEAVSQLLEWLSDGNKSGLSIPRAWPGLATTGGKTTMSLTRVPAASSPCPGILAHMYFGHGDGAWLVLYAWLRLEAGLDPYTAYMEAQRAAQGTLEADLTDYLNYLNTPAT